MALYKNARLRSGKTADILVKNGVIAKIGAVQECEAAGEETVDLGGKLVSEPYCDPHIHLDYVFTAQSFGENTTGTLFDGIASWSDSKSSLTPELIKQRAKKGLREQILGGTQYIRTHIDVTDPALTGLKQKHSPRYRLNNKRKR